VAASAAVFERGAGRVSQHDWRARALRIQPGRVLEIKEAANRGGLQRRASFNDHGAAIEASERVAVLSGCQRFNSAQLCLGSAHGARRMDEVACFGFCFDHGRPT